ncbi:hypothetical protein BTVI_33918 [Pitangus sulphuratus]|nr:hypothetical protein BTVI_33918 [Pitangus sulphuratus]
MPEGGCDPHGKPMLEQDPGRSCGSVERGAHTGAGLLAGLVTPWEGLTQEQFLKDCNLWEGPTLKLMTVSHGRNPRLEQGKNVRSPPPEKKE